MSYLLVLLKRLLPTGLRRLLIDEIKKIIHRNYIETEKRLVTTQINKSHITNLKAVCNRTELLEYLPKDGIVAELGVAEGNFARDIMSFTSPSKLHLIDCWSTERYNEGMYLQVKEKFSDLIKNEIVCIHRAKSTEASKNFPDHYFDWIYIDTDHSYETTINELRLYSKKVKHKGFIAGHDFVKGNLEKQIRYGVREAVYQFCAHENWEIIYLTMEIDDNPSFVIRRMI